MNKDTQVTIYLIKGSPIVCTNKEFSQTTFGAMLIGEKRNILIPWTQIKRIVVYK